MRLFYGKGDRLCKYCEEIIGRGDKSVMISFLGKLGYYVNLYYHCKCYMEQLEQYMTRWFEQHPKYTRMGRPKVHTIDREERRRLLSRYAYHRKQGNVGACEEIESEIKRLSYGQSPY
jgi:hypothetical protein